MESSPASLMATQVYLPESSSWALEICNTRPPENEKSDLIFCPFCFLSCECLHHCFSFHLVGLKLCRLRRVVVHLCTRSEWEGVQRLSHSTERWDCSGLHPERLHQSLRLMHHQLHRVCWNLVELKRNWRKNLNTNLKLKLPGFFLFIYLIQNIKAHILGFIPEDVVSAER